MNSGNSKFEREWRRRFEHRAGAFDDDAGIAGWSGSGLDARVRGFQRAWQSSDDSSKPPANWLDAGCGAGTYSRFLASHGHRVTAVDYSIPTVVKARSKDCRDAPANWAVADVTRLPFANAKFSGALCFGVMQALSEPHGALRELRRVLVDDGVLWVDALNILSLSAAWSEARRSRAGRARHLRYDAPREFVQALSACGFGRTTIVWMPIAPSSLHFFQPPLESRFTIRLLKAMPALAARLSHSILLRASAN